MNTTNGFLSTKDEKGNETKDFLFTFDNAEHEQNLLNKETAEAVFSPKFIPFYPNLLKLGLSLMECLVFGFIDFYLSSGDKKRFYFTDKQLAKIFNCSENTISNSISKLKKTNLLLTSHKMRANGGQLRLISLPPENWDFNPQRIGTLTPRELGSNNNNINNNNKERENSRFAPPSLSELQEYIALKQYHVDAVRFINFYESKGWMVGKNKMKNWQAAVGGWEKPKKEESNEELATRLVKEAIAKFGDCDGAYDNAKSKFTKATGIKEQGLLVYKGIFKI